MGVSAPRTRAEWMIFGGGVLLIVTAAVVISGGRFRQAIEMGVAGVALTLESFTILVYGWGHVRIPARGGSNQ